LQLRSDNALPIEDVAKSDSEDPKRQKDLTATDDPILALSKSDTEEASFVTPTTDIAEPRRTTALNDTAAPREALSKSDKVEPTRICPKIDTAAPNRA
jgi:hypothetical protein